MIASGALQQVVDAFAALSEPAVESLQAYESGAVRTDRLSLLAR
jgi:hypothetical protein